MKISSQSFLMTRKKILSLSSKYLVQGLVNIYAVLFRSKSAFCRRRSFSFLLFLNTCPTSLRESVSYLFRPSSIFQMLAQISCSRFNMICNGFKISLELSAPDFSGQSIKNSRYFKTFSFYLLPNMHVQETSVDQLACGWRFK